LGKGGIIWKDVDSNKIVFGIKDSSFFEENKKYGVALVALMKDSIKLSA